MQSVISEGNCRLLNKLCLIRSTQKCHAWIVKHAFPIPPTPPGREQRPPTDKLLFQLFEKPKCTESELMPKAKILLIKNVEGIGKAGEIVDVRSHMVREFYVPSGSAVYASPFNVEKYRNLIESSEEKSSEPHVKLGISQQLYDVTVLLNSRAVPVLLALENAWSLEKWHVAFALQQLGVAVSEKQIILPKELVRGPNLRLQNLLFRFYVVANNRLIMPAYGRYQHVTTKTYRQMLTPSLPDPASLSQQDMDGSALIEEDLCAVDEPGRLAAMSDDQIWTMMQDRMLAKKKEAAQRPDGAGARLSRREQAALDADARRRRAEAVELLRCQSFGLPLPPAPWDADELQRAKQRARRHRYWDDDLHNWPEPLGRPR